MLHSRLGRLGLALAAALLTLPAALSAQIALETPYGRALDHADYDLWNRIANTTLSPDGEWLAYRLVPQDDDGWATLVVKNVETGASMTIMGGDDPTFTDDSRYLVTLVEPDPAAVKEAEEAAEDDESVIVPQAELQVVPLDDVFQVPIDLSAILTFADIDDFRVPSDGESVVAMRMTEEAEDREEDAMEEEEAEEEEEEEEDDDEEDDEADGQPMLVVRLDGDRTPVRVDDVTDYAFTQNGDHLYFVTNDSEDSDGVYRWETDSGETAALLAGRGRYLGLTVSTGDEGTGAVAFMSDVADVTAEADMPGMALYVAEAGDDAARLLVETTTAAFPEGWGVSEHGNLRFSEAGTRVFFGTRPLPEPEEDEEEEEIDVELDVWNWQDGYLQPMQLVQARGYDERTWQAIARVDGGGVLQLADEFFEAPQVSEGGDGGFVLSRVSQPYRQLVSWDRSYYDYYLTDLEAGATRELVLEQVGGGVGFVPGTEDLVWWDGAEKHWFHMDRESGEIHTLTANLPHPVHDELHDSPSDPGPYGAAGWTEDGDFIVYDRYDVWRVEADGSDPRNLTAGAGRAARIEFRHQPLDFGEDFVPSGQVYLSAFGELTKDDGWYRGDFSRASAPTELLYTANAFGSPQKAEDADRLVLTRSTFREFPDLYTTDGSLASLTRQSDANPQQSEYRWGTAELYEWTSADGIPLQGILYKPDGFDPDEEYPMMVYFYERSSDGLHSYTTPSPGGSSINRAFYVSRGYLVFVPDIPYEIGFPGESAEDAVIPGVLSLIDEGFVDADKVGVQGHSWGGYQISHMITRSDIFAAAEAGAPVVNMTSAYGGIRWASGMSRAFQYEKTQSRIGGTLWDSHQKFIENSPLFFVDKINTPLLMMHNDEDGAVPWYQGIEMFSAMRRLGKPVWMLNYNGEAHGLRQDANRRDWAIRMQQFFDHYLMDQPMPVWMDEGVPATMKGKTLGLELVRPRLIGEEQQQR
jgi:dienelactone hydrolase